MTLVSSSRLHLLALGALISGASGAPLTVSMPDQTVWTVGVGVAYPDMTITKGESLKFMSTSHHDVALVHEPSSGTAWDQCGMEGIAGGTTPVWGVSDFVGTDSSVLAERHYTPPTCGDFYIACSVLAHCMYGQRFKLTVVNADDSACAAPCEGADCVTADSKLEVQASGTLRDVKPVPGAQYWGQAQYNHLTVNIGETVVFNTSPGYHDVATVPSMAAMDSCDVSEMTVLAAWKPGEMIPTDECASSSTCCVGSSCGSAGWTATFAHVATTAGDVYFVCSIGNGGHCKEGQKFRLTVKPLPTTEDTTVTPGSDTATTTEDTTVTPGSDTASDALRAGVHAFFLAALGAVSVAWWQPLESA